MSNPFLRKNPLSWLIAIDCLANICLLQNYRVFDLAILRSSNRIIVLRQVSNVFPNQVLVWWSLQLGINCLGFIFLVKLGWQASLITLLSSTCNWTVCSTEPQRLLLVLFFHKLQMKTVFLRTIVFFDKWKGKSSLLKLRKISFAFLLFPIDMTQSHQQQLVWFYFPL